ncbi:hypothetical protein POTOM_057458 [Populus tomentosa]|uniref:Uncharacterized protein n=1 Tax=Populus tomentosa TaxID=118781 RepID=A0A8X7XT90_POPTO|nr:hypothetical protein POTOM_057458 [Populus tomentosa]
MQRNGCGRNRLDDLDSRLSSPSSAVVRNCGFGIEGFRRTGQGADTPSRSFKRGIRKGSEGLKSIGRSLRFGVPRGVFPEDLKVSEKKIFDPQDKFLQFCNKLFLISCILAVSVDPLFFYLPVFSDSETCLGIDRKLATIATTFRTIVDAFYLVRMALQFRTAYIAPSSRVFGRGELVIDPTQIAKRFSTYVVILALFCSMSIVERNDACWRKNCTAAVKCKKDFLYCGNQGMEDYGAWDSSILNSNCSAEDSNQFDYGIYSNALSSGIVSSKKFISKYCYCLWWGLQNLRERFPGNVLRKSFGDVIMSLSAYWFIYQWILTTKLSDCKVILVCVFEAGLLNFQAYILPCSLLLRAICVLYQIWPFILLNAISGLYSIKSHPLI